MKDWVKSDLLVLINWIVNKSHHRYWNISKAGLEEG